MSKFALIPKLKTHQHERKKLTLTSMVQLGTKNGRNPKHSYARPNKNWNWHIISTPVVHVVKIESVADLDVRCT